jgi:MFS family permease
LDQEVADYCVCEVRSYRGNAKDSIFLIATVTSLDSNTTQVLVPYATSSFNTHSLLSVIGIVSGVMIAVVKAPMAKIGDVFGRMEAFLLSVLLYVAGYIQMAASRNVEAYAVTQIITNLTDRVQLYFMRED